MSSDINQSYNKIFKAKDLKIIKTENPKAKPDEGKLLFGAVFTDHMFSVNWDTVNGWDTPTISELKPLSLHPGVTSLHYGLQAFEGLKAYRDQKGDIRLFRPQDNFKRLNISCERMCFPSFDEDELLKCLIELVTLDKDWVPRKEKTSLYIRPLVISTDGALDVKPASKVKLLIICSPVGSYYKSSLLEGVSLYASAEYVRAWPGGTGEYKIGGNYGPTMINQRYAAKNFGCSQILWLFNDQLTEVGSMNIFVLIKNDENKNELVTPPLNGMVLPGITRNSILQLAQNWPDVIVSERMIDMSEMCKLNEENRILEVFGTGTACVVSPVSEIVYKDKKLHFPENGFPFITKVFNSLTDIQYGKVEHDWNKFIITQ